MSIDVDIYTFLEHHGVKGQKWGVRNEERPSGRDRAKAAIDKLSSGSKQLQERNVRINTERKNMLGARAAKTGVRIDEINKRLQVPSVGVAERHNLTLERKAAMKQQTSDLKKSDKQSTSGLTSTQKKVLVGAGVAAGVVATYGLYRMFGTEEGAARLRTAVSVRQYGDVFKKDTSLSGHMSADQILHDVSKQVNPNYSNMGGQMNCRRCTLAHELRRRGYDVHATPSAIGRGQNETGLVNALIKDDKNIRSNHSMSSLVRQGIPIRTRVEGDNRVHQAFQERVTTPSARTFATDIKNTLSKHPNGARGEIAFVEGGFAHSMAWEIIDGVPHIFDSQKGQHFPVNEEGMGALVHKWGLPRAAEITRLDDVDLDLPFLSQWAMNNA